LTEVAAGDVETARAIERAVLDYFEGWFEGDAARMERALHPELAKRRLEEGDVLDTTTAQEMVDATAAGVGRGRDVPDRRIEIELAALDGSTASVVVRSAVYLEYVHLARTRDGWKIVNTLWQPA
jgi:hypothetical protein